MLRLTKESTTAGSWEFEIGRLIEYFSLLCEEALEVACFGPYDGSCSTL